MSFTTVTTHQVHHIHKRASQVPTAMTKVVRDKTVTVDMPIMSTFTPTTTMKSSSSSSSHTYHITNIPLKPTHATLHNPYIDNTTLPRSLLFIILGAILGAVLVAFVAIRVWSKWLAHRSAKNDCEKYDFLTNSIYLHSGFNTSNSSMMEVSSTHSTPSLYMLSKNIAAGLVYLLSDTSSGSGGGRSYRNAIKYTAPALDTSNTKGSRGSMFISPALEAMNQSKYDVTNQYKLPMMHRGALNDQETYSMGTDSPVSAISFPSAETQTRPVLSRPPSQLLDDILDHLRFDI